MSYKKRKLNNRGFSLVEVLVAIVILAIISLPVLSTFSNAARINARARRTENANTAINNIIEEAKTMSLENLVNRQGQYYYAPTTDNNTYVVSDERGVSYYTGVNGEKYYIKATFDPGPYTDSDSTTDNKKNNNHTLDDCAEQRKVLRHPSPQRDLHRAGHDNGKHT